MPVDELYCIRCKKRHVVVARLVETDNGERGGRRLTHQAECPVCGQRCNKIVGVAGERKQRVVDGVLLRRCSDCQRELPADLRHFAPGGRSRLTGQCRACWNRRRSERRREKREAARETLADAQRKALAEATAIVSRAHGAQP